MLKTAEKKKKGDGNVLNRCEFFQLYRYVDVIKKNGKRVLNRQFPLSGTQYGLYSNI